MRLFLTVLAVLLSIVGVLLAALTLVTEFAKDPATFLPTFLIALGLVALGGVLWMLTEISRQLEAPVWASSKISVQAPTRLES